MRRPRNASPAAWRCACVSTYILRHRSRAINHLRIPPREQGGAQAGSPHGRGNPTPRWSGVPRAPNMWGTSASCVPSPPCGELCLDASLRWPSHCRPRSRDRCFGASLCRARRTTPVLFQSFLQFHRYLQHQELPLGATLTLSTGHCGCYPRRTKATGTPTGLGLNLARVVLRAGLEGHWPPRWLRFRSTGGLPHGPRKALAATLADHCARCAGGLIRGTVPGAARLKADNDETEVETSTLRESFRHAPAQDAPNHPSVPWTTMQRTAT